MAEISITGPHERRGRPVRAGADAHPGGRKYDRPPAGLGEITIAPHTEGPPQHRHGRHDEGFYVVSGTARFTVGGPVLRRRRRNPGHGPAGSAAHLRQSWREPAVLLNTFTPDLYVQYFRDLRDMIAAGQPPTPASGHRRHGPLRHRARHRLRLLGARRPPARSPLTCRLRAVALTSTTGAGPPLPAAARRRAGRRRCGFAELLADQGARPRGHAGPSRLRRHPAAGRAGQHRGLAALYTRCSTNSACRKSP